MRRTDDISLYDKFKPTQHTQEKNWNGLRKSASMPSELYIWFFQEKAKQTKKEINELDIADIEAALKGVKNCWSNICIEQPKIIDDFLNYYFGKANNFSKAELLWKEVRGKMA